jgi:hypothetical protein
MGKTSQSCAWLDALMTLSGPEQVQRRPTNDDRHAEFADVWTPAAGSFLPTLIESALPSQAAERCSSELGGDILLSVSWVYCRARAPVRCQVWHGSQSLEVLMRILAIPSALAVLSLFSANVLAKHCQQLEPPSAQIACLQDKLEAICREVEQFRSMRSPSVAGIDRLAELEAEEKIR